MFSNTVNTLIENKDSWRRKLDYFWHRCSKHFLLLIAEITAWLRPASPRKRKRKAMKRIKQKYKISKKGNKKKSCHMTYMPRSRTMCWAASTCPQICGWHPLNRMRWTYQGHPSFSLHNLIDYKVLREQQRGAFTLDLMYHYFNCCEAFFRSHLYALLMTDSK